MNQEIRNYVMQKMSPFLDNGQTLRLERILEEVQLKQENGSDYEEDNAELLEKFIAAKRLEGRSDGTLNYYQFTIEKMFEDIGKNIRAITTEDLRDYLSRYYTEKEVSKVQLIISEEIFRASLPGLRMRITYTRVHLEEFIR